MKHHKTHAYFIKNNKIHIYFMKHHKTHAYFIKNNKKFYTPCFIYYRQPSCLWVHDASFFMGYNTSMSVIYHSVVLSMQCFAHVLFFKYKKFMGSLKPHSLFSLGGDTPLKLRNSIKEILLFIAKLSRRVNMQYMHSISAYVAHLNRRAGERHARNA